MKPVLTSIAALGLIAMIGALPSHSLAQAQSAPEDSQDDQADPTEQAPSEDSYLPPTAMAAVALLTIVTTIDEDAQLTANRATFPIDHTVVTLVFDINAARMRLFSQIAPSDGLSGP